MHIKINTQDLSKGLDKLSRFNGSLILLFFIINLFIAMQYIFVFNRLVEEGTFIDYSIVLVPALGLITLFLLYPFHTYSTNIRTINDLIGLVSTLFCISLLYSIVPIIGSNYDIIGISVSYWKIQSQIIVELLVYLIIFSITNFIIKTTLERDKLHG